MEKEVIVKWKVRESETARILCMLPELAEKSKREEGNLIYEIYQSENDPNEFILHEKYVNADAAEAHRKSEHYQKIVADEIIQRLVAREVTLVKKLL